MRDERAPVGLSPHLLKHVSFSAFIGADERDMLEILQLCAGMPFVVVETIVRGVQAAVVTGTLSQWQDAVVSGCSKGVPTPVRHCFNKLHGLFTAAGLNVWRDYTPRSTPDQTFLLLGRQKGPLTVQFRACFPAYLSRTLSHLSSRSSPCSPSSSKTT